jgi:polygalacturonase
MTSRKYHIGSSPFCLGGTYQNTDGYCSGGHHLSIGSVGGRDDYTVEAVTISSIVKNSQDDVYVKTVYDATETVKGVTYKNIVLEDITKYVIVIEQDYEVN